jgi:hypothetical protein
MESLGALIVGGMIDKMTQTQKAVSVLVAALVVGFSAGVAAVQLRDIPDRVTANEARIEALEADALDITDRLGAIEKALELNTCLALAERRDDDWRQCL